MMNSEQLDQILLEEEQKELLMALVEAWRNIPRENRRKFIFVEVLGRGGLILGLDNYPNPYLGDIEALADTGLLNLSRERGGHTQFDITAGGFEYYRRLKQARGEPVQRVTEDVRTYLEGEVFKNRHPDAYAKWAQAEALLWSSDTNDQLTTIGHLCREAVQLFATSLVVRYKPPDVTNDVTKTVKRISAVLEQHNIGKKTEALLKALLSYWVELNELVQRQEHGAQKEGEALKWEDGRRVVFHTAIAMFEIDKALST